MSRNNFQERLRKMQPKKDHYSIRKFSIGAASVLIVISFLGLGKSQTVKAETIATQPQSIVENRPVKNPAVTANEQLGGDRAAATDTPNKTKETIAENSQSTPTISNKKTKQPAVKALVAKTAPEKASAKKGEIPKNKKIQSAEAKSVEANSKSAKKDKTSDAAKLNILNVSKLLDKDKTKANKTNQSKLKKMLGSNIARQIKINGNSNYRLNFGNSNLSFSDNSNEITYASLAVAHSGQVFWNKDDSSTSTYWSSVNKYHKTNDGSDHDAEIAKDVPTINKIAWTNFKAKNHKPETIVYVRQADGSYKLISGAGLKDANGDIAPLTIAAGQITSAWKVGFNGNSNVSNFSKTGTSTSLARAQWNDRNAEQKIQTGIHAGNSKAQIVIALGPDATKILSNPSDGKLWCNVYSNYYGAQATGAVQTFKQDQDISNLSQAQYRQLVDVTDLGQNGWNGININPDAPQVLAYIPGYDYNKQFYMTWAPRKEPSTAKIANGVDGTVRIHFGDGTWLDIAIKINVKADQDSDKPDHDKSEFTQKIIYTYNKQEVAYTTIDNIARGGSLSAETLKNAIDSNVPANYTIKTDYTYPAGITDIQATPKIISVPLDHNADDSFTAQGQIVYKLGDDLHIVASGNNISSHIGDTLTAGLLKDLADQGMRQPDLKGYIIVKYPASYDVTKKYFSVPVIVEPKAGTEIINPTNQKEPDQQDLFKDVTRTIRVHNPNGKVDVTKQVVHFNRTKKINTVTGKVISYGDWQLVAGSAKDWPEFTAPVISGYTADPAVIAEKSVTPATKNTTVDIYYHKTNNGGGSDHHPGNDDNPGNHNNSDNHHKQDDGGQNSHQNQNIGKAQSGRHQIKNGGQVVESESVTYRIHRLSARKENSRSSAIFRNESAKRLPQTGKSGSQAVLVGLIGLGLAAGAGLLGLAGDRKRKYSR